MVIIGGIVLFVAVGLCCVACTFISRTVNDVQVARRDEFEHPTGHIGDYETMLPGDEQELLADYRQLKQIDEDRERALYDGGGW